jgi:predicted ATPase
MCFSPDVHRVLLKGWSEPQMLHQPESGVIEKQTTGRHALLGRELALSSFIATVDGACHDHETSLLLFASASGMGKTYLLRHLHDAFEGHRHHHASLGSAASRHAFLALFSGSKHDEPSHPKHHGSDNPKHDAHHHSKSDAHHAATAEHQARNAAPGETGPRRMSATDEVAHAAQRRPAEHAQPDRKDKVARLSQFVPIFLKCSPLHTAPMHLTRRWMTELFRAVLGPSGESAAAISAFLLTRMPRWAHPILSLLAPLLDLYVDGTATASLTDGERDSQRMTLVLVAVEALVDHRPVLLFVDDLHFADEWSIRLLRRFLEAFHNFTIVATVSTSAKGAAHSEAMALLAGVRSTMIELSALDRHDAARFIAEATSAASVDPLVVDTLYDETQGVPIQLRDIIANLMQAGLLWYDNKHVCFAAAGKELSASMRKTIPEHMQTKIVTMFDHMAPSQRTVLAAASIAGPRFSFELLRLLLTVEDAPAATKGAKKLSLSELRAVLNELSTLKVRRFRAPPEFSDSIPPSKRVGQSSALAGA